MEAFGSTLIFSFPNCVAIWGLFLFRLPFVHVLIVGTAKESAREKKTRLKILFPHRAETSDKHLPQLESEHNVTAVKPVPDPETTKRKIQCSGIKDSLFFRQGLCFFLLHTEGLDSADSRQDSRRTRNKFRPSVACRREMMF